MKSAELPRLPRKTVKKIVKPVIDLLKGMDIKFEICGSWRRKKETCKDLDILIQCKNLDKIGLIKEFNKLENMEEIRWSGDTKISFFYNGFPIDIKAVPKESWGAGLLHHTGSAQFNLICRRKAKMKGWLLNEYGLWTREDKPEKRKRICNADKEINILKMLWLEKPWKAKKYMNPEEREI